MFMPKHCAEVAVINAREGFSPDETIQELIGKLTFYLTKYIVLRERGGQLKANEKASIIQVKTEGRDLLTRIVGGEVIAQPDKCITIVDPTIDEFVLNQVVLRAASVKLNDEEAVILSGKNENVTFVYLGEQNIRLPLKVMIVDTIPPSPNRLAALTRAAGSSGQISDYVVVENLDIDTSAMVEKALKNCPAVFSLCSTGESSNPTKSITSFNVIAEIKKSDKPLNIELIGCSLSQSVLNRLQKIRGLNFEVTLRDICPLRNARAVTSRADVCGLIVRCCKMIEKTKIIHINRKPIVVLPWAPSLGELVNAIDDLVKSIIGLEVK